MLYGLCEKHMLLLFKFNRLFETMLCESLLNYEILTVLLIVAIDQLFILTIKHEYLLKRSFPLSAQQKHGVEIIIKFNTDPLIKTITRAIFEKV